MTFTGKPLAEIEVKLIVINFLRKFKFSTSKKVKDANMNVDVGLISLLESYMVSVEYRDENKSNL